MIKSLTTAKTGLSAQQMKLDVIANNLANVSTSGFKRSRMVFEDLLYQNVRQTGAASSELTNLPSGLQIGTGVRGVATERLHTPGSLEETQNSRDLAINGRGFFQVFMPDGRLAYTRDGSFQTNQFGELVTASGYTIEPRITVPEEALSVSVSRDGLVTITEPGSAESREIGQLNLAMFTNETGLESIGENLYLETTASGPANIQVPGFQGAGTLVQGYVEGSNVNVVEEMVSMIQTQRAYEINSKSISSSDEMLARLGQL